MDLHHHKVSVHLQLLNVHAVCFGVGSLERLDERSQGLSQVVVVRAKRHLLEFQVKAR
jgi:hypothetical protein